MITGKTMRRRGATLLEIVMAAAIFLMMMVIGYSVWSAARRALASAESGVDVRESALLLFSRVREELEDALYLQTGADGRLVIFMSPFQGGGFEFDPQRSELHGLVQGGKRGREIRVPGLKGLTFQAFPGGVLRVELTLMRRKPSGAGTVEEPVSFVDELYLPGLVRAAAPGAAQWNSTRDVPSGS